MKELLVARTLIDMGISPELRGYNALKEAILIALEDESAVHDLVKTLYPAVALRVGSTYPRVERNMRHAIEVAWEHTSSKDREVMFNGAIHTDKGKPTVGQFIAIVAEYTRLWGEPQ